MELDAWQLYGASFRNSVEHGVDTGLEVVDAPRDVPLDAALILHRTSSSVPWDSACLACPGWLITPKQVKGRLRMNTETVGLDAARCAELVAPALDRLRLTLADSAKAQLPPIAAAHGLDMPSMMTAAYLRNVYPDRVFSPTSLLAVFTYQSTDQVTAGLRALLVDGHLEQAEDERLSLSVSGRNLLHDIVAAGDQAAQDLWSQDGDTLDRLLPMVEQAVAAIDDGGDTFAVMAPSPGNEARLSEEGRFAELLTALRFHRFDNHIAAWRSAGLSLAQIKELGPGPERDAIESETNLRASTPYRVLSPDDRLELVAGLAALHG